MKWVQKDIVQHHVYYSTCELVGAMLASAVITAVLVWLVAARST